MNRVSTDGLFVTFFFQIGINLVDLTRTLFSSHYVSGKKSFFLRHKSIKMKSDRTNQITHPLEKSDSNPRTHLQTQELAQTHSPEKFAC